MAADLEIPLQSYGPALFLALILDGRETVSVPRFTVNGGPITPVQAIPDGPVVVVNRAGSSIMIEVAESEELEHIAGWDIGMGNDAKESAFTIPPASSITLPGTRKYLGIRQVGGVSGIVRPAGLVGRGPASAAMEIPQEFHYHWTF